MDDNESLNDVVDNSADNAPARAYRVEQALGMVSRRVERLIGVSRYNSLLMLSAEINLQGARTVCSTMGRSPEYRDRRIMEQSREQLARDIAESGLTFLSRLYLRSEMQRACPSF